ncbi:PREDICTED: INO80 complex subunit D-like [Camelina sativa]|uniref:KAT8 regulatory NSL complex subunit 2 n=1 Tax=Camelina sativa TaxID=90675 RepID=A0ABM0Z464_CAMSA|nr:PREDICTED: INO80 complex subunit D-like [Camelina sativa]
MASASKNSQQNPSSSKPPRPPTSSSAAASSTAVASTSSEPQIRNPNPNTNVLPSTSDSPIVMSQEDEIFTRSSHLTRPELLRRRSHNLKQLAKCYRDHYWALMEDLKGQHRDYWWKYGSSPFKDEHNQSNKRRRIGQEGDGGDAVEGSGDNGTNNDGGKTDQYANSNCGSCMYGCKAKAMALTKYCQLHILKDSKQKLYTGCTNVIKRAPAGPLLCGKPTLASTVPALCNMHFQKSQKLVSKALKDAGHNTSSTSKPPPKLHVIVAAFVHHIQAKRKNPQKEGKLKSVVKEENIS